MIFHPIQKFTQQYTVSNEIKDMVPAYLDYLKGLGIEYAVYVETNVLLSRQSLDDVFDRCDRKENWFTENEYFYGKNLIEQGEWTHVGDPIYQSNEEIREHAPTIAIFTNNTICGNYYDSWMNDLARRYRSDENIYVEVEQ